MAQALELSAQHTAVRVQRMKAQLEAARVVERALDAQPPCEDLRAVVASWDGLPSALWRKRIARHARACLRCGGLWNGLLPAEGLLAGLALVPVSAALLAGVRAAAASGFAPGFAPGFTSAFTSAGPATTASAYGPDGLSGPGAGTTADGEEQFAAVAGPGDGRASLRKQRRTRGRRRVIGGAVLAACVVGGGLTYLGTRPGTASPEAPAAALVAPESGAAPPRSRPPPPRAPRCPPLRAPRRAHVPAPPPARLRPPRPPRSRAPSPPRRRAPLPPRRAAAPPPR